MASPSVTTAKTSIDLLNNCDRFPRAQDDNELYQSKINSYYHFRIASSPVALGYVLPFVAEVFGTHPGWELDNSSLPWTLTLTGGDDVPSHSAFMAKTLSAIRSTKRFQVLEGWRDELKDVFGSKGELVFSLERSAIPLLGVVSYGVYLTAFTRDPENQLKIWIARRAKNKSTYPGFLEVVISGGISAGENPFDTVLRESNEEASIPEDLLRSRVKCAGMISYIEIRDERAGGETELVQPEAHYVYDCELPNDLIPKPNDDEVEGFQLWTVNEVRQGLQRNEFKPGLAHVILYFLVRQGIVTEENDPDFVELVQRLHRKLEFPVKRSEI